jgi:predicted nucleotide-binding protein
VNEREIATRGVGEHVGEMAMVDSTARRSATVVAKEHTTFAKMTEAQFSTLAAKNPNLWRRIAVTLVDRLKERNKFHPAPRNKPVVFIGSSLEGSRIAEALYNYLLRFDIVPRLWSDSVFEASQTAIEDLVKLNSESDFAIIILTPDDFLESRGARKKSPRDNAIFELGLFMGGLTRKRTYIVTPRGVDIKIPTDLLGVTRLQYQRGGPKNLSRRLRGVKKQLYQLITKYGPR